MRASGPTRLLGTPYQRGDHVGGFASYEKSTGTNRFADRDRVADKPGVGTEVLTPRKWPLPLGVFVAGFGDRRELAENEHRKAFEPTVFDPLFHRRAKPSRAAAPLK